MTCFVHPAVQNLESLCCPVALGLVSILAAEPEFFYWLTIQGLYRKLLHLLCICMNLFPPKMSVSFLLGGSCLSD